MRHCTEEDIFFAELLAETKVQFRLSQVCKKQVQLQKEWNYAVCATPIKKILVLFLG